MNSAINQRYLKFIEAASLFYGKDTAEALYVFTKKICKLSFEYKITPDIPIILTTAMSSYNRFSCNYIPEANTIEIVRHHCHIKDGYISPIKLKPLLQTLAHELCHVYQYKVIGGKIGARGPHRCKSWYASIKKASPYVCGVDISSICSPLKSIRIGKNVTKIQNPESLTEPELTHWPSSIFKLVENEDPRVVKHICSKSIFDECDI